MPPMPSGSDSSYDSFVIRLWHTGDERRLLRVEIDHIQTGAVYVGREVAAGWVEETLIASVRPDGPDHPASAPSDPDVGRIRSDR